MKKIKFYHFIPAIIFFFITFYLFTLPGEEIPQIGWFEKIQGDKLVHIGLFFFLVIGFSYPFNKSSIIRATRLKWFLCFAIVGVLYGISVEFIQKYYIPGRSFGIDDMIADAIGCIAGYYCVRRIFTNKV
ncbi:MAG: VanZ family protein [Pedobacter sp.]|nr:VanZ family protein [Chitinophagaceae bacterium]